MQSQYNPGFFQDENSIFRKTAKEEFNCDITSEYNAREYYTLFYGQFHVGIQEESDRNLVKSILSQTIKTSEEGIKEFNRALKLLIENDCYLVLEQIIQKHQLSDEQKSDLLIAAVSSVKSNILNILIRNGFDINSASRSLILCALKELGNKTTEKLEIVTQLLDFDFNVDDILETNDPDCTTSTRETCQRIYNGLSKFEPALRMELGLLCRNVPEINEILVVMHKVVTAPTKEELSINANKSITAANRI